ncbi:MAG: hypothetical protein IPM38_18955 [Ignavibacteria bacterium]|nr:hypothetical protein [Ignavibacteria bacterium]
MENISKDYSREELLQSIPDFINGKISDSGLSNAVSKLIESDNDFKNEFDEINKTLTFFVKTEFPEPPDNYFNNLPVIINEKINPNKPLTENPGLVQYFSKAWKIILPAFAVILIAAFFIFRQENTDPVLTKSIDKSPPVQESNNSNNSVSENQIDKKETLIPGPDKSISDPENSEKAPNAKTELTQKTKNTNFRKQEVISPDKRSNNLISDKPTLEIKKETEDNSFIENKNTDINNTDFADIFDIDEFNEIEDTGEIGIEESELLNSSESDDVNLQNEFRELSPADQQEILNVLKETKI